MFLTVCNLILSPHLLGRSILDEARDQPIPGSFLKTLGTRLCRDLKPSNKQQLGRYLSSIDWSVLHSVVSAEDKAKLLEDFIIIGLDNIMPESVIKIHSNDAPWMTTDLKSQIKKRQMAL